MKKKDKAAAPAEPQTTQEEVLEAEVSDAPHQQCRFSCSDQYRISLQQKSFISC